MLQVDNVRRRRKEITELRHADAVFRDIEARVKEREKYKLRWFWELMQNAKDSVEDNSSVKIIVDYDGSKLVFSHTGEMFEMDDILSLIIQGSSKVDKKDKDGRFGTGFLTTYLLSKKVRITGKAIDENKETGHFQFWLDRTGELNNDFYKSQTDSNLAFDNSIQDDSYLPGSEFQTEFVYELDADGIKTAEAGLQSLDELIPFTQLFNNKISSIVANRPGRSTTYEKQKLEEINIAGTTLTSYHLTSSENGRLLNELKAYVLQGDKSEICFITSCEPESVKFLGNIYPKLYFTFPLIGTERLGIPLVINSRNFDPKVERDGIYLLSDSTIEIDNNDENENINITKNKDILKGSLILASAVFAKYAAEKKIKGIYELFNFSLAAQYPWLDNDWMNTVKKELLINLSSVPCISISKNSALKCLNAISIPIASDKATTLELWSLINEINDRFLPNEDELDNWVDICKNWLIIQEVSSTDTAFIFELTDLLDFVITCATVEKLQQSISTSAKTWLNDCYSLINKEYETFPLKENILVNQHGNFRQAEGMFWDDIGDEALKGISEMIGLDFKNDLINDLIDEFAIPSIKSFTKSFAVSRLSSYFNSVGDADYLKTQLQDANAVFLKWLIANNEAEVIKDMKIICGDKKREDDLLLIGSFIKGKHLILPPLLFFENNFPLYAKIIRDRDCMNPCYYKFLDDSDFRYLADNGFILYSPLLVKTEKIDPKSLELLLVNPDDIFKIRDEDGKLKYDITFKYSDFAYLTTTEGHIYDRNSTPTSSLERFKFLLLEATEKDDIFEEAPYEFIIDETGAKIAFNRCLWLSRAKNIQWIYNKNVDLGTDKKASETPSSKNLSSLIKDSPELIKAIKGDRQQLFLNRLGVGVSDLIRNTLPTDELRSSWDKAITSLFTSEANPEMVQEIFNDPGIQKEYQRRLRERKLISRNQNIGKLVEDLFREAIEEMKSQGVNIDIKREPFGSDYLLTEESSDLVSTNRVREAFKVNDWLVELKATGKHYAAMTPLQAKTAKDQQHRYALVVVPLSFDDVDLDYVKKHAKVISTIGSTIEKVIVDFDDVEHKKALLTIGEGGVSVLIEDENVRFRISCYLWEASEVDTIESFIRNKFRS